MIFQVAMARTLHDYFDYLPPKGVEPLPEHIGQRIRVPFRRQSRIGIITHIKTNSDIANNKLKHAEEILDASSPIISPKMMRLCQWLQHYYHAPMGEIMHCALPKLLREGHAAQLSQKQIWQLTAEGQQIDLALLQNAPKQQAALQQLRLNQSHPQVNTAILKALAEKNLVVKTFIDNIPENNVPPSVAPLLNSEQQQAINTILSHSQQFTPYLLQGITGSGKTEVYLHCVADIVAKKQQVLILVPEIGLTPQLLQRFQARFQQPIAVIHSGLNDRQRLDAWLLAKTHQVNIVIGTRSAIFTPMPQLAMIIIDEEHDASFKQQEGIRYNAHDLALVRAKFENIPIVLGSATPLLESLHNCQQNKYQRIPLTQRAAAAQPARYQIIDIRSQSLTHGLSNTLIKQMQTHLDAGNQVLLFINRRGYAPVLMCHKCGWASRCSNCETHLTLHRPQRNLQCHHCHYKCSIPTQCPDCASEVLSPVGIGTQRLEAALNQLFPQELVLRIDRDNTQNKFALQTMLEQIHNNEARILLGTQMLAKGHDFPNVTLVGIINADAGFYSTDFRASEKLGQLLVQVAGRSGRAAKAGEVLIQTYLPEHPLLNLLIQHGFDAFAKTLLSERQQSKLPPYSALVMLRSEGKQLEACLAQLQQIKLQAKNYAHAIQILGPIPASMPKRAGVYRAQMLMKHDDRQALQQLLKQLGKIIRKASAEQNPRLILDVDPLDVF